MSKTTFPCVDLKFEGNTIIRQGESREGVLGFVNDDHFHFTEQHAKPHEEHPELHWRLLDRTKHGRIHTNANHIKVEFYIHHDDYKSATELADILASEIEKMGDTLCDINLEKEVAQCGR